MESQLLRPSSAAPAARVRRVIVSVADLDASLRLYAGVGLGTVWHDGDFAQLLGSDGTEVLLHRRMPQPTEAAVAIGFQVEGLDRAVATWIELGGSVVDDPTVQPWGEVMATLRDVDGHVVCMSQDLPAQPPEAS